MARQRQCLGFSKLTWRRCRRRISIGFFCDDHKLQPVQLLVAGLAVFASLITVLELEPFEAPPEIPQTPCGIEDFKTISAAEIASRAAIFEADINLDKSHLWNENGTCKAAGDVIIRFSDELQFLYREVSNNRVAYPGMLVFVYGAAGSGKSSVATSFRALKDVAFVDLGDLRYKQNSHGIHPDTSLEADLIIGDRPHSEMAHLKQEIMDLNIAQFVERYGTKTLEESTSVVFDGLDELHPFSSSHILNRARQYFQSSLPGKNMVFFGRGEAFRDYYLDHKQVGKFQAIPITPIFVGKEPLLSWFVCDFLSWGERSRNPDYIPPASESAEMVATLKGLLNANPDINHLMFTNEPANTVLRNLKYTVMEDFTELLFLTLINRNSRSHNRPTSSQTDLWVGYSSALTQSARMLEAVELPNGFFKQIVKPKQMTMVPVDEECLRADVATVLNRSGVISLDPFNEDQLEYEFWPLAMQDFLRRGHLPGLEEMIRKE